MKNATALINLIVSNNPYGVYRKLQEVGAIAQNRGVNAAEYIRLFSNTKFSNKQEAIRFLRQTLDVPVNNSGVGAKQIWQIARGYNQKIVNVLLDQLASNPVVSENLEYSATGNTGAELFQQLEQKPIFKSAMRLLAIFGLVVTLRLLWRGLEKIGI